MIHHFSEIQKQQLLNWQSMVCGVMVCKVIPFSWEAVSENNYYDVQRNA